MCTPNLEGMNGDVQSDLATLAFNNGEQVEDFHSRIIRLQQEIILSGETVSPTILIFHYMKELSKSDKIKAFIAPKMKDLIIFLDNNVKNFISELSYFNSKLSSLEKLYILQDFCSST